MGESLVEIRQGLRQAIDLLEVLYGSSEEAWAGRGLECCLKGIWLKEGVAKLEEDLWALEYSSQKAVIIEQGRLVWNVAVRHEIPTRWFTRIHRPVTVLLSMMCERAGSLAAGILNAEWENVDFARITSFTGRLAAAPLKMADAREPGALLQALPELFSMEGDGCVVCDWPLAGRELSAVRELKAESQLSFVFPRGSAG